MRNLLVVVLLLCSAVGSFAQLTQEQKVTDFKALVGVYDKNYAPYEWKKKAFDSDLLKIQPWLDQVEAAPDDLSFYDVCVRYVASLHDAHSEFTLPGHYEAWLPITADIYDGKVLIDSIDRTVLDPQTYPFDVGDELLAVDGKSVGQWITELSPYAVNGQGSSVSRARLAVATLLDRFQGWYPFANKMNGGDTASILVRSQNGKVATFRLTWDSAGLPMDHEGRGQIPAA